MEFNMCGGEENHLRFSSTYSMKRCIDFQTAVLEKEEKWHIPFDINHSLPATFGQFWLLTKEIHEEPPCSEVLEDSGMQMPLRKAPPWGFCSRFAPPCLLYPGLHARLCWAGRSRPFLGTDHPLSFCYLLSRVIPPSECLFVLASPADTQISPPQAATPLRKTPPSNKCLFGPQALK